MSVFRTARLFCFCNERRQFGVLHFGKLLLARKDIHRELFEVDDIHVIHLIERCIVFHQPHLIVFKGLHHALDVLLCFVVFHAQRLHLVHASFEESEDALFVFGVEILQFADHLGQKRSHFAELLRTHALERTFGKVGHLLLCASAILHDHVRIVQIDLLREVLDHLLFFRAQCAFIKLCLWCWFGFHGRFFDQFDRTALIKIRLEGERRHGQIVIGLDLVGHLSILLGLFEWIVYEPFLGKHGNVGRDIPCDVFEYRIEQFLESSVEGVKRFFDLLLRTLDGIALDRLAIELLVSIEQLDREGQIVIHKLFEVRQNFGMLLSTLEDGL